MEEQKQNKQIMLPRISIEIMTNDDSGHTFYWDKESVGILLAQELAKKKLLSMEEGAYFCAFHPKELDAIVNSVMDTLFKPQAIEEIVVSLIEKMIRMNLDIKIKNPEIKVVKS